MKHWTDEIGLATQGEPEIVDITSEVQAIVSRTGVRAGLVCVANPGSTGGITTIEFEQGVLNDLREALERLAPRNKRYQHDAAWGDGNGYAHVRSALMGTSQAFPIRDGKVVLGTWQQIVFLDFDNRPRRRTVVVEVIGE